MAINTTNEKSTPKTSKELHEEFRKTGNPLTFVEAKKAERAEAWDKFWATGSIEAYMASK